MTFQEGINNQHHGSKKEEGKKETSIIQNDFLENHLRFQKFVQRFHGTNFCFCVRIHKLWDYLNHYSATTLQRL